MPSEHFKVIAPTRVDLAGGTLDLWPLYCFTGHARTINLAIDLFAEAVFEIHPHATCKVEVIAEDGTSHLFYEPVLGDAIGEVPIAVRFPVYVISQYLAQKTFKKHLKVSFKTAAPLKSGLGGSSTLCVALARGMAQIFNDYQEQGWRWQLLNWVKDVEAAFLRTPTGTQDYLAALFGGLHAYHYNLGTVAEEIYPAPVFEELSKRLVVVFSGEQHHSGISNWELFKKANEGDKAVLKGLEGIRKVAADLHQEFQGSLISWTKVGKLLDEEWRIRRETFQVHTPGLDEIISFIKAQNVLGVKVCGAAAGGSLIVLVEPHQKSDLIQKLKNQKIQVLATNPTLSGVTIESLIPSK